MAKARKILKRVKAVGNIRTVTKTMEMVATARFRKAHHRVVAARELANRMMDMVADLVTKNEGQIESPLLRPQSDSKRHVLMVLTSNRGLAGGYNSGVLRLALDRFRQIRDAGEDTLFHVKGKKGVQNLRFRQYHIDKAYTDIDYLPAYEIIANLAQGFIDQFAAGEIASLEVAYMQFAASGSHKPSIAQLLPMSDFPKGPGLLPPSATKAQYEFLPSVGEVLRQLLPATVKMKLYQCFLDAGLTEQMARMTAMRSATENADEMLHSLRIAYNRARQSQITTELAEIMGGRAGIEG